MTLAKCRFQFEPRDCWVGLYWCREWVSVKAPKRHPSMPDLAFDRVHVPVWRFHICLLPCLPLCITIYGEEPPYGS